MTAGLIQTLVAVLAAVLGAIAGRVFALEAENRLAAVFAGTYVGAGAGLMSSIPTGSVLALVAQYLNAGSSTWFDALDVAATALLWGTAGGAGGGLAISIIIAALNSGPRKASQSHRDG
jgi:hypothetical protein